MSPQLHPPYNSTLSLNDLHLKINIGVSDEERKSPQDITISFKLFFKELPSACTTDNIQNTTCYHEIASTIEEHCKNTEFQLLEYLCLQLHNKIRQSINSETKIWIKVEKCNPPITALKGSTSFEYADF